MFRKADFISRNVLLQKRSSNTGAPARFTDSVYHVPFSLSINLKKSKKTLGFHVHVPLFREVFSRRMRGYPEGSKRETA